MTTAEAQADLAALGLEATAAYPIVRCPGGGFQRRALEHGALHELVRSRAAPCDRLGGWTQRRGELAGTHPATRSATPTTSRSTRSIRSRVRRSRATCACRPA